MAAPQLKNGADKAEDSSFLDTLYNWLREWAFLLLIVLGTLIVIIEILLETKSVSDTFRHSVESVETILISFVPLLVVGVFIDPLISELNKRRERISQERLSGAVEGAMRAGIGELRSYIETFDPGRIPSAVSRVYETFQQLPWGELLKDAAEVDLAVAYFSGDWLGSNLGAFQQYLRGGGKLRLYLPPVSHFDTKFYELVQPSSETVRKIIKTMYDFRLSGAEVRHLERGLGHVTAKVKSKEGVSRFVFSPFRNNPHSEIQPPAIVLNEERLVGNQLLHDFVRDDMDYLDSSAPYPNLEDQHYLTWDFDRQRVFVSVALTCSFNCDFCYIKSVVSNRGVKPDPNFGEMLAYSVLEHPRFNQIKQVLVGGFSEPFLGNNSRTTVRFINTLTDKSNNYIHVATRSSDVSKHYKELNRPHRERVVINYSVSSLSDEIGGGKQTVQKRMADASEIVKMNGKVALYVRPVVPGRTLKAANEIATVALGAGIRHVTIGGLYIDDTIEHQLSSSGVQLPKPRIPAKTLVLDRDGRLKKLPDDEVQAVRATFRAIREFAVFDSSYDLLYHYTTEEHCQQCRR